MIQRSRASDAATLAILIVVVAGSGYGYWRLCRWRDDEVRTRAAEVERCKAACDKR